jgi:hypothetical protein
VLEGVVQFHDAELLPGGTDDHTHLTGADAVVNANLLELDGYLFLGLRYVELRARPVGYFDDCHNDTAASELAAVAPASLRLRRREGGSGANGRTAIRILPDVTLKPQVNF